MSYYEPPVSPCKGCKDRTPENPEAGTHDCHATCEAYQEFWERSEEYRLAKYKTAENEMKKYPKRKRKKAWG